MYGPMRTEEVVVFGGAGFLGRRVVGRLIARGMPITIASRNPETPSLAADASDREFRIVQADVRDRNALGHALKGAQAAVNCVGLYVETRTESFHDVHVEGARAVAEIARACGVRRLVHISGVGVDRDSASAYIRARAEGEDVVRSVFPDAAILRPSAMFSRDGAFFGALEAIVRHMPVIPLFGDGGTRLQPVHVGDVAEAVCRALVDDQAVGTVFELGDPEIFTYREILERLAAHAGRWRLFLPVPFALWWALARVASLLPRPPLTPAQVTLMRRNNVVGDGVATFSELGIRPRSSIAMGMV
jgi:NADH dehydrogenase